MIEAKDLRIGNILTGGLVVQVNEVSFKVYDGYVAWDSSQMVSDWMKEQPIPLTEEWLIKFGFGYWEDVDEWYSPDDDAILRIEHFTKGDRIGFFETNYGVEFKYVHQIQNFYSVLDMREELTIKE